LLTAAGRGGDRESTLRHSGAAHLAHAFAPNAALTRSGIRRSFILIVATIVAFALLWYATLRGAAKSSGGVNVLARAAFLILTSLACIAIGFLLPLAPGVSALIGSAFWAGLLATVGALAGMSLSDELLTRLETSESGGASA
jgi:hypothetical protein